MSRTIICEGNNPVGKVICNIDNNGCIHRGNNPVGDIIACVGSDGKIYEGNMPYGHVIATMGSDNRLYEGNTPFGHVIATVGSDGKIYDGNMPFGHVIANVPQFQNGKIPSCKNNNSDYINNEMADIDCFFKNGPTIKTIKFETNWKGQTVEKVIYHNQKKPSLGERICKFLFG